MNVRLFVSSVFTDCQRDLLAACKACVGRGSYFTHCLCCCTLRNSHTNKYNHTHANTHTHIYLCSEPEIIAYFTEINRISISCTHAERPQHHCQAAQPRPVHLATVTFPLCTHIHKFNDFIFVQYFNTLTRAKSILSHKRKAFLIFI